MNKMVDAVPELSAGCLFKITRTPFHTHHCFLQIGLYAGPELQNYYAGVIACTSANSQYASVRAVPLKRVSARGVRQFRVHI